MSQSLPPALPPAAAVVPLAMRRTEAERVAVRSRLVAQSELGSAEVIREIAQARAGFAAAHDAIGAARAELESAAAGLDGVLDRLARGRDEMIGIAALAAATEAAVQSGSELAAVAVGRDVKAQLQRMRAGAARRDEYDATA
ncbi:MAG: hypothetical protein JNK11_15520 [Alphaproteobacteria bacterium]|nr:hypothetical protein [Alphaproteobacteria bacterium]